MKNIFPFSRVFFGVFIFHRDCQHPEASAFFSATPQPPESNELPPFASKMFIEHEKFFALNGGEKRGEFIYFSLGRHSRGAFHRFFLLLLLCLCERKVLNVIDKRKELLRWNRNGFPCKDFGKHKKKLLLRLTQPESLCN